MSATPGAEVVGRYRSDENVPARGAQAYPTSVESCGTHTEHEGPVWVIFLTVFIAHKADCVLGRPTDRDTRSHPLFE